MNTKSIIIKINFILMLGILICGLSLIGGIKQYKTYASNIKEVSENKNEKLIRNKNIKLLSSLKINKDNINNIKPSDIKTRKLKKVVVGPNTRRKLNKEEANTETVSQDNHGNGTPITLNITFYTDLDSENGGCGGYVSNNKRIAPGMVASTYNYGTRFYIPSFGKHIAGLDGIKVFQTEDRMASSEASKAPNRMDIYVPRLPGESDTQYSNRVNNYGRYSVKAYKL